MCVSTSTDISSDSHVRWTITIGLVEVHWLGTYRLRRNLVFACGIHTYKEEMISPSSRNRGMEIWEENERVWEMRSTAEEEQTDKKSKFDRVYVLGRETTRTTTTAARAVTTFESQTRQDHGDRDQRVWRRCRLMTVPRNRMFPPSLSRLALSFLSAIENAHINEIAFFPAPLLLPLNFSRSWTSTKYILCGFYYKQIADQKHLIS